MRSVIMAVAAAAIMIPAESRSERLVGTSPEYSYDMLDHTRLTNRKIMRQMTAMESGELRNNVTFGGNFIGLINYQRADSESKFGYLMRHPTSNNQREKDASEAVVHSANLNVTAKLPDNLTIYLELLYNPEQSFGSGTITDLDRNQIQARKAYALWSGRLQGGNVYAALGKMDAPFGLNDTVSPFTNSSNWHAFAGLGYGAQVGWYDGNFGFRAMAIQGGAQFRSLNVPIDNSDVPSKLSNFAVDASYEANLSDGFWLNGASWVRGTAYCQEYPVTHFFACEDEGRNPGIALYSLFKQGRLTLLGEYARTLDTWPGSRVASSEEIVAAEDPRRKELENHEFNSFDDVKVEAFTVGARYDIPNGSDRNLGLSAEFSRFIGGDDGSPWEKQDQFVLGVSYSFRSRLSLFFEYIHVGGYVPLNFISGGNIDRREEVETLLPATQVLINGQLNPSVDLTRTTSEADGDTNVVLFGLQAAF